MTGRVKVTSNILQVLPIDGDGDHVHQRGCHVSVEEEGEQPEISSFSSRKPTRNSHGLSKWARQIFVLPLQADQDNPSIPNSQNMRSQIPFIVKKLVHNLLVASFKVTFEVVFGSYRSKNWG